MIDFDPIDFLTDAVKTPSNDEVDPMRDLLCATLETHGAHPRIDDAGNVLASIGDGSPHLVLNTHLDTVSPHVPFERCENAQLERATQSPLGTDRKAAMGIITGRGACDAKGSLAAMVSAFLSIDSFRGRLTLAVTPDEETASFGAAALNLDADGYIVGEPTGLDVCNAAKGRFEGVITIEGRSAHAATPERGINAITAAGRVLDALIEFDARSGPTEPDRGLGQPTLTPTTIRGGEATNQVPSRCQITVDRRTVPPETAEGFFADINEHLRTTIPDATVSYDHVDRETPFLHAFETPDDSALVQAMRAAGAGPIRPFPAATEASYFARSGPTVVFGPGDLADDNGPVAHSSREYVPIDEVLAADAILQETICAIETI